MRRALVGYLRSQITDTCPRDLVGSVHFAVGLYPSPPEPGSQGGPRKKICRGHVQVPFR